MRFTNLAAWLDWIQSLHVTNMDLSLERVAEVARRLDVLKPSCPVVTIGGTNGKGSCVAGLEAIYCAAGYRVGAFTSPILLRHNEYIRIQGVDVADKEFCSAFERIDGVRGEITLTPFEFNALAAFVLFQQANLDVWILEVGLGGRFDAVNVIDADVAVIASIGIDHIDILGDTREKIGYEKAGIFRAAKPVVCGDYDPPASLLNYAKEIGAIVFSQDQQFGFEKKAATWKWWSEKKHLENLPLSNLALQNMATVLMAVEVIQDKLPVTEKVIQNAIAKVTLPGRIQVFPGTVLRIFDVSHNPAAAELLAVYLRENSCKGKTRAVFSMLQDKDILSTLLCMKKCIDEWAIAMLKTKRAATVEKLQNSFQQAEIENVFSYDSIANAYQAVMEISQPGDRVVVFGSFHTVAEGVKC